MWLQHLVGDLACDRLGPNPGLQTFWSPLTSILSKGAAKPVTALHSALATVAHQTPNAVSRANCPGSNSSIQSLPQSLFEAPASAGRDWLPSPIPNSTAPYMAPPTFNFCLPPSIAYHSKRNRRLINPISICPATSALGVAETLLFVFFLLSFFLICPIQLPPKTLNSPSLTCIKFVLSNQPHPHVMLRYWPITRRVVAIKML